MSEIHKVLVVDDCEIIRSMIERILQEAGYQVEQAPGGHAAVEIAREFRPDVVLLDLKMPGMMGEEVCRRLREEPACTHAKIIMVSSSNSVADRLATYSAGADDFVTKPFDEGELLAKIRVFTRMRSLEEVEQAKDRVMEVLQHTTRTPLQNILGYADLLLDDLAETAEERQEFAQVIIDEAKRLQRLLEKSELLAQMKSGRLEFARAPLSLSEAAETAVYQSSDRVRAHDLHVHVASPETDSWVAGDAKHIGNLISMVLDNAIRFTPNGGDIDITVERGERQCAIRVTDSGPGIPDQLLPAVFGPLANLESPLHNTGDGLDLCICREIAVAHGGTITAHNEPGRGASITLTLPACAAPEQHTAAKTAAPQASGSHDYNDWSSEQDPTYEVDHSSVRADCSPALV